MFTMYSRSALALLAALLLAGCSSYDEPTIGFYLAIHRGDLNQIERHIHWGTDINQPDANGDPPLHVAVRQGRLVIARLLVRNGARIDAVDAAGHTALHAALMSGRTQIADFLIESGATFDADELLDEAVRNGVNDRDVFAFLKARGADPNHRDARGRTPLINAIGTGNRVAARMLIGIGADVNLADSDGKRPLEYARDQSIPELVSLLTRNGAY